MDRLQAFFDEHCGAEGNIPACKECFYDTVMGCNCPYNPMNVMIEEVSAKEEVHG